MNSVSLVIPVYNDTFFLRHLLQIVAPVVREVVVVDGGRRGLSTDGLHDLLADFTNAVYTCGESGGFFITDDGVWDKQAQVEAGLSLASREIVMVLSADRIPTNIEALGAFVDAWDGKGTNWYAPSIDFWMDSEHIRPYNEYYNAFSTPVMAFAPGEKTRVNEAGDVYIDSDAKPVLIPDLLMCHFGWLRPFEQQVQKHIDHVLDGNLEVVSDILIPLGYRACESWAIQHALGYRAEDGMRYDGTLPCEVQDLAGLNYMDGFGEYKVEYERRYRVGFFDGVLNTCPHY